MKMRTQSPPPPPRLLRSLHLRSDRITRFAPFLLFALVSAGSFVGVRVLGGTGSISSGAEGDLRKAAILAQESAGQSSSPQPVAWIHHGYRDRDLEAMKDHFFEKGREGADLRQLERQDLETRAERHHLNGLLAIRSAGRNSDRIGESLMRAEQELTAALQEEPDRAAAWSDLAAVYLLWAARLDQPHLYLDSYSAAHAARSLEPELPEARFNQSLALEALGLFQEAAIALEGDWPTWTIPESIARRRVRLSATDPVELYENFVAALAETHEKGDAVSFTKIAALFPPVAGRWAEEVLLPRWATAHENREGERAAVWLSMARAQAETIGDLMLRETVEAIDHASGDPVRLELLARGHGAYGRGMQEFPERIEQARAHFEESLLALEEARSPFAAWARFYSGACRHIQRDLSGAMDQFDRLSGTDRFPSLEVRRGWARGLIFLHLSRFRTGLNIYRPAREQAAVLGDYESAAAIAYQEAEASKALGSTEAAWRSLALALAIADQPVRARYRVNILFTAADLIEMRRTDLSLNLQTPWKAGLTELQELFLRRAIRDAERSGIPAFVAQIRGRMATFLESRHRIDHAQAERERAGTAIEAVADEDLRRRLRAELGLGMATRGNDEVSESVLLESLETFRQQRLTLPVIETALALADLAGRRGEEETRERWLAEAQRVVEVLAVSLEPMQDRYRYLALTQKAFRSRINAALERPTGGAERALELYLREQKLRHITFSELSEPLATSELGADVGGSSLPPDAVFIAWLSLPGDRLVALALNQTGAEARFLPLAASELAPLVTELRSRIAIQLAADSPRAERAVVSSLEELSRKLIDPIVHLLPREGGLLGMSLDDAFAGIPFEALSTAAGQRLVESFLIARVSRPEILSGEATQLTTPAEGALVVGASIPARSWRLAPLKAVGLEVEAIQQALGLSKDQVLSGPESTFSHILRQLPDARWLHFAGHALPHPYDASASVLILAEDGKSPTSLSIQDLTLASRPRLEVAVLAGCDTARSGTSGIAQALERGGVPIVIGSQWPVEDDATQKFFVEFYRRLGAGVPPVQAFHETQLAALSSEDPQLATVAVWAAFAAWGF